MIDRDKCIICRKPSLRLEKENKLQQKLFTSWKTDCSKTLCEMLFGNENHRLLYYFKTADYCSRCHQTLRDFNLAWDLLKSFQDKTDKLSTTIKTLLRGNYNKVGEKATRNELDSRILSVTREGRSMSEFNHSYDEVVEMIYKVSSSSNKNSLPVSPLKSERAEIFQPISSDSYFDVAEVEVETMSNDVDDMNEPGEEFITYSDGDKNYTIEIKDASLLKEIKPKRAEHVGLHIGHGPVKGKGAHKKLMKIDVEEERLLQSGQLCRISCKVKSCKSKFYTEYKMEQHYRERHEALHRPQCPKCNKTFQCSRTLSIHLRTVHVGRPEFCCKYCGKGYFTEVELTEHYSTSHHGPNPFTCAFCDVVRTNSIDLRKHVEDSHADKLKCPTCGKIYALQRSLEIHQRIHQDLSVLPKCPICGKAVVSKSRLKRHIETHNTEKAYTCDVCGKGYRNAHGFQAHMYTHKPEKPFKCKICGKGFHGGSALKIHEVIHTGVKEYVCPVCGAAFASKYNMLAHEKIHEPGYKNPRKRTWKKKNEVDADGSGSSRIKVEYQKKIADMKQESQTIIVSAEDILYEAVTSITKDDTQMLYETESV